MILYQITPKIENYCLNVINDYFVLHNAINSIVCLHCPLKEKRKTERTSIISKIEES